LKKEFFIEVQKIKLQNKQRNVFVIFQVEISIYLAEQTWYSFFFARGGMYKLYT